LAIFIGAFIYIPFCAWEIKMGPTNFLHKAVYGFHQHDISMSKRGFGYRPMAFMQQGIAVGMWMCMASMIGIWMTINGTVKSILGMPMALLSVILTLSSLACNALTGVLFLV